MPDAGSPDAAPEEATPIQPASGIALSRRCQRCDQRFDITNADDATWTTCPACRAGDRDEVSGQPAARPEGWVPVGGYFG
jgi:hypothetical protein